MVKIEIMTKAQVKLIVEEELRKQSHHFYKILDRLRKRIIKLEEKTKYQKIKLPNKNRK